jgi:diguanylate cyclase (GGDEF)-like protein
MRRTLREGDAIVRWGGEEFLACLPGVDAAGAWAAAEKLRGQIAALPLALPGGATLGLTASLGIAEQAAGEGLEAAIARADAALYAAKRGGRNRVMAAPDPGAAGAPLVNRGAAA